MAESLLSSNFDIIFIILFLLPTETLLQVQMVCRAWAQVISDPAFVRAHCSRPAPITALFTRRCQLTANRNAEQIFKPFQEGGKFPRSISGILSRGFKVVSRNYGVLCFRRDMIFIVGNPATSSWSVVPYVPPRFSSYESYCVALIYNPTISLNFKLAIPLIKSHHSEEGTYCKQFNIYSSETCSWTISSEFIHKLFPMIDPLWEGIWKSMTHEPCKIRGGSVCWRDEYGFLVGYEIFTDTYWRNPPPLPFDGPISKRSMSSYDNTVYFTNIDCSVAKVWRLEEKHSWVLEGEGSSEELRQFDHRSFAYDRARRALLIEDRTNGELFALHLSSSRLEFLSQGAVFPAEVFRSTEVVVAHGNSLAPLHGAETGMDGLVREFNQMRFESVG